MDITYSKILEAIESGVKSAINEALVSNHRGRPTTRANFMNLYVQSDQKDEERYIRAWAKNFIYKAGKTFYLDNLQDVNELRRLYIMAIYKFMEKNKSEEYDWEAGNERFSKIYNLNDIAAFNEDLRKNYKELCGTPNFPGDVIKLSSPEPVRRGRKRRSEMSDAQLGLVNTYIGEFGKGTLLDDIDSDTIEELRKYTLANDGFVYSVCRPIRDDSDSNAPAIVYKLTSKYSTSLANAIRLTYKYQCEYDYGCYVNYMYVSPIHLDKYMKKEGY